VRPAGRTVLSHCIIVSSVQLDLPFPTYSASHIPSIEDRLHLCDLELRATRRPRLHHRDALTTAAEAFCGGAPADLS
jgi:hypothetical protein